MRNYEIIFPDGFDDYAWEVEYKGWLSGVVVKFEGIDIRPVFYDPARLTQEINDEISDSGVFLERNVVVLDRVSRERIEAAVDFLASSGRLAFLKVG